MAEIKSLVRSQRKLDGDKSLGKISWRETVIDQKQEKQSRNLKETHLIEKLISAL
jgi:hypothetical protein